jgi:hypothetical protein
LEKLAMPIALHPDPLISIILPASVYPTEIVQAARFVKNTNNVAKVDEQPWDENVKAVAKFPDMIGKMDADLDWTIELGKAFLDQPKELMDTIQSLRAKAQKAGTLKSSPQQVVTVTNEVVMQTNVTQVVTVTNQIVQVQPANPQVVYVPSYPPTAYYPPPGYVYDPVAPLVTFGVGMAMGAIIANNCDWHGGGVYVGPRGAAVWGGGYHGDVDVDVNRNVNVNQSANVNRTANANRSTTTQQKWQPDQNRVHTSGASAQTTAQAREARGWGGGSSQSGQTTASADGTRPSRPDAGSGTRPSQPPATADGTRPSQPPSAAGGTRPSEPPVSGSASRPSQTPSGAGANRPSQTPAAGAGSGGQPSAGTRPSGASRSDSTPSASRPSAAEQPSASRSTPSSARPEGSASRGGSASSSAFSGVSSGGGARDSSSRGAASRGGGGRGGGGRGR